MSAFHCARCGYLISHHDGASFRCPGTVTATFEGPGLVDHALWREIIARDSAARSAVIEEARRPYEPVTVPAPLIPARPPRSRDEFASARQGGSLGKVAMVAGFDVQPLYWKSGTGVEGCAVRGRRDGLAFAATWKRAFGAGKWVADVAYVWPPVRKVGITELGRIIRGG